MATKKQVHNFAVDLDAETLRQFENCYKEPYVTEAALMPDAHVGYVAPIGAVLVTKDKVVPAWVGYDIGCGMTAVRIKGKKIFKEISSQENKQKIYNQVKRDIPMGLGETNSRSSQLSKKTKTEFDKLIKKFKSKPYDKGILQFIESKAPQHIGSLGHGNHFIALCQNNDEAWIVVHSGSRGIGHTVATKYMKKSSGKEQGYEET